MVTADSHHHDFPANSAVPLLADRQAGWAQFCRLATYGIVGVVVALLLMRLFLVA